MEWFQIIERIIGHIAWPIAAFFIVAQFSDELKSFIRRIKNAKYKGVEIDLSNEIQSIKNDAELAGITIAYPSGSFPEDSIRNIDVAPEWAFIQSWQDIENVIFQIYAKKHGAPSSKGPISNVINTLVTDGVIDESMSNIIQKLKNVRNKIVHAVDPDVTRGEALEWLGISKSVRDRLVQKTS